MKKRRSGFTLIELIVVITIIGVLAAILVPSMMGYIKKSKISSANMEASAYQKAINSVLIELDEEYDVGSEITSIMRSSADDTEITIAPSSVESVVSNELVWKKILHFLGKASKASFKAECEGGGVKAVAVCLNNIYTGTCPSGVVNVENYKDYKGDYEKALTEVLKMQSK